MKTTALLAAQAALLCIAIARAEGGPAIEVRDLTGPDPKVATQVTLALTGVFRSPSSPATPHPGSAAAYRLDGSCMLVEKHFLINLRVVDRANNPVSGTAESLLCADEELSSVLERLVNRISAAVIADERAKVGSGRQAARGAGERYAGASSGSAGTVSVTGTGAAPAASKPAVMHAHRRPQ